VLKPSEESPIVGGLLIAEIFEEAGVSPGVLNVITCSRADVEAVGDVLVTHPAVGVISFTGSTTTGRALAEKAGRHLNCIVLELGGKSRGQYFEPTVLTGVTPEMRCYHEETFGPVVALTPVKDAEEAVRLANDTTYGLSAAVITGDPERGMALAQRIQAGMVHVNDSTVHDEPHAPFGGIKGSGLGRHGGSAATTPSTADGLSVGSGAH